nr:MAG TPA: 30S ribosomal protein S11 [Caudoviricetes sp.]
MSDNSAPTTNNDQSSNTSSIRFCPICGAQMYQGMRYGFKCWICPECDFDEPA